jgi:membrane protein
MASTYGAAGALIIVLVWVYYSAQILLLGAEFAKAYSDRRHALGEARGASVGVSD